MGFFKSFLDGLFGGTPAVQINPVPASPALPAPMSNLQTQASDPAQEVPGVVSSIPADTPNQEENGPVVNFEPNKIFTLHAEIKQDWEGEDKNGNDRINLRGGHLSSNSQKEAFFSFWPIALDGEAGAGIANFPGAKDLTFFCDTHGPENLNLIQVKSGGLNDEAEMVYMAVSLALVNEAKAARQNVVNNVGGKMTVAKRRAQVVFTVLLEEVISSKTGLPFEPMVFTKKDGERDNPRAGKVGMKYLVKTTQIIDFKVVFEGDPEYIYTRRNTTRCLTKAQKVSASDFHTDPVKAMSRDDAFAAAKRGEITRDDFFQALYGRKAPRSLDEVRQTINQRELDKQVKEAEAKAQAENPAPAPDNTAAQADGAPASRSSKGRKRVSKSVDDAMGDTPKPIV